MNAIGRLIRSNIHYTGNVIRWVNMSYLRLTGVEIGKNTMISLRAKVDVRRGRIRIGDGCHITYGCVILSHDRAAQQIDPEDSGEGSLIIGNNVFIGVNSVVLRNVTIGDNSVIGAGSIVTKDIPANVLASGNPAKVIRQL